MNEEKREKLMRDRQSTLTFGNDPIVMQSEAMENFQTPPKVKQADRAAMSQNRTYLRGKHWELGTDNLKPESTTRRDYNFKKSSTAEKTAAIALKKDLTKEHYYLGFADDPSRHQSMYKEDMSAAAIAHEGSLSHEKATKPPCSVILGSQGAPTQSTAQAAYVPHDLKLHATEHVDGRARGLTLRKSHLLMGTDDAVWDTNQSAVHRPLEGKPSEPFQKKTDRNISLGTDAPTWQSEIQTKFSQVEELKESCRTRASLDPHLKADLRGHHFAFGTHDEGSAMQSCSQAAFTEKRSELADRNQLARIRGAMKEVNLTLGNDAPVTQSAMRQGFGPPPMAMLREAALGEVRAARKQANTTPNFQFGVEDAVTAQARECSLQHADMRVGLDGVDYAKLAGLSDEVRADLRKHHFAFGLVDEANPTTTSQAAYVPPPEDAKPGSMEKAVKADLRRHHFTFGDHSYADGGISTTTGDQLVFHGKVDTQLSEEVKKDLRAVHFVLGRDGPVKESMYGSTYLHPNR